MPLFTGLLYRKHIYKNGRIFATMIPGTNDVRILPNKYQDIIPYDSFDLTYPEYEAWLKENNYEEREPE